MTNGVQTEAPVSGADMVHGQMEADTPMEEEVMLNVLSLFSGIGAFEKALENLGIAYNLVSASILMIVF